MQDVLARISPARYQKPHPRRFITSYFRLLKARILDGVGAWPPPLAVGRVIQCVAHHG